MVLSLLFQWSESEVLWDMLLPHKSKKSADVQRFANFCFGSVTVWVNYIIQRTEIEHGDKLVTVSLHGLPVLQRDSPKAYINTVKTSVDCLGI